MYQFLIAFFQCDFLGKYLKNHQKFGSRLKYPPRVFATNYFLKNPRNGKYLNGILDKLCWVIWAEGRTNGDYDAINTPIGFIPQYKDLKEIFKIYLNEEYSENDYIEQFSIRIQYLLEKLDRVEAMYKKEKKIPDFFWRVLEIERSELLNLSKKYNKDVISPFEL